MQLTESIQNVVKSLYGREVLVVLTRPDEQFGDYATNIALQLAGQLGQKPRDIAQEIVDALKDAIDVKEVVIAGPGFINIRLTDNDLLGQAAAAAHEKPQTYKDKVVVAEYSDPNPFKALHAGHLYTTIVGDAIANLLEVAGGHVHRVNFGGDVGPHVARAMWAITKDGDEAGWQTMQEIDKKPVHERAQWLASQYVAGTAADEADEAAHAQIVEANKKVYQLHRTGDHESLFAKIYWLGRDWSYEAFEAFYKEFGVHAFEKYYPESSTADIGITTVREQLKKGVYKESQGAVVFEGEPFGLHTRVFINQHGLPTYEAKDVGLIQLKWQDYHFDKSIIITASEQQEYMQVVLKSIEQFEPEIAQATTHLTHGLVKLEGGVKMSSRKGNVLFANDILEAAEAATPDHNKPTAYAAVKYALLKQRLGGDIAFNPAESVSLEGNSGPYLQYAHARARSILAKAPAPQDAEEAVLEVYERSLARKISEYPEAVAKSVAELMPHHICNYLYELAQTFNRFYEHSRVIGDEREALRLQLVAHYADVLKDGLTLLNIAAPERL